MADYNKVLLIGRLTRDPELRYAGGGPQGGTAICKLGLAVNRNWRGANNEQQEETCFVDITVFGRQAETCNEYLRKGRSAFVEGHLKFDTWEDRESGQKRSKLHVVAERVQFLGGPSAGSSAGSYGGSGAGSSRRENAPPAQEEAQAPATAPAGQSGAEPAGGRGVDFDDIPF